jgi:hypothetical protein
MAKLKLKSGHEVEVDDSDMEELKKFDWKVGKNGYVYATVYMHRLLVQPRPGYLVDHEDRNRLNNRRKNLRECTHSQNSRNTSKSEICKRTGNPVSSKFKGVSRRGDRWRSTICIAGKRMHLGTFDTEKEAAEAYLKIHEPLNKF